MLKVEWLLVTPRPTTKLCWRFRRRPGIRPRLKQSAKFLTQIAPPVGRQKSGGGECGTASGRTRASTCCRGRISGVRGRAILLRLRLLIQASKAFYSQIMRIHGRLDAILVSRRCLKRRRLPRHDHRWPTFEGLIIVSASGLFSLVLDFGRFD